VIIGAVVACVAIGGILWVLFGRTEQTVGTVSILNWERSVPIEVLGELETEAWFDEVPADAEIQSCQESYRYTQSEPAPNAVEICGTPYTIDEGSGYGEVVQDCEYEIYDDLCSYTTIDWIVLDTVTVTGDDLFPFWPDVGLMSDQRIGEGQESYQVTFSSEDQTYNYTPEDESEFSEFVQDSRWILEVNAVGSIVSLEPAR
jgi:hypothetical protein